MYFTAMAACRRSSPQVLSTGIATAEKSGDQHARSEMEGLLNELS
jgi:hypothetical protein